MAAQNGQKVFGAGRFYGTAISTSAVKTPTQFGVAQDIAIDFKRDIKKLFGQNQLPVDVSGGMLSITGKVTNGILNARAFNDLLINGSLSTGQVPNQVNEAITITTGATTYTSTNGAGYNTDLGIYGATDGVPLVKVSTGTSPVGIGNYSVSTLGVYAFSSLDARTSLFASYLYSTIGGQSVAMTNQPMGRTGSFQSVVALLWGTEKATISFNNCISSDFGFATKLDDYTKPTFGFEAATDASDVLGTFSFAELS